MHSHAGEAKVILHQPRCALSGVESLRFRSVIPAFHKGAGVTEPALGLQSPLVTGEELR